MPAQNQSPQESDSKGFIDAFSRWYDVQKEGWTFQLYKTKQNIYCFWLSFKSKF